MRVLAFVATALSLVGQPAFEVASVKLNKLDTRGFIGAVPGGILAGIHSEPPYAVIGLGTGILAAHAKPWQHVVFYEIDPLVKRLSVPPDGQEPYFYYVQDAVARGAN